jgi:hypothetical protein
VVLPFADWQNRDCARPTPEFHNRNAHSFFMQQLLSAKAKRTAAKPTLTRNNVEHAYHKPQ